MKEILQALEEIYPEVNLDLGSSAFPWNPTYQVAARAESQATIKHIFGESVLGRMKNFGRNTFKLKKPFRKIEARFPQDAVIFYKPGRERLIMASKSRNLLLKLVVKKDQFVLFDEEVKLLKSLENTEFSSHVSQVVAGGITSNEVRWIATTLGDNSESLQNFFGPEKNLLKNAEDIILKPMAKFYQLNDLKRIKLHAWLELASVRVQNNPNRDQLLKFIEKINAYPDTDLLEGQLHFDLHAGNILFDGKKSTFIDWEVTHRGLILVDVYDAYRRVLNTSWWEERKFFKGVESENLRKLTESYHRVFNVSSESKLNMMLYALERTLIYQEKWQANRLGQTKGIEYKIIN